VKPRREAAAKQPVIITSEKALSPREARGISRERKSNKRIRKLGGNTEERDTPLLPEKELSPRSMLARLSKARSGARGLSSPGNSQPKRNYEPPSKNDLENNLSGLGSAEGAITDDATEGSSLYRSPVDQQRFDAVLSPDLSEITSNTCSFTEGSAPNTTFTETDTAEGSSALGWTDENPGLPTLSYSTLEENEIFLRKYKSESTEEVWSEFDPSSVYKQRIAGASIAVSAIQLALLFIQLIVCGIATLEVNPMIGPFPDAFSEWGGKNAYLLLDKHQYFRLITPVFLHVGVLHFAANAFCQLEACALFEREWGSCRWLTAYIISGVGAVAASCVINPDEIGVSSSGAIMGLYGAKISQVVAYNFCRVHSEHYKDISRFDQMGGVFCSASVVFLLSLVTYIDLSANVGGFVSGFLAGMLLFCRGIASRCTRFIWAVIGFGGLVAGGITLMYLLWVETYPDAELEDACEYFRHLYPEGYSCECKWG
jgi:membrane associated rhomboid family serine protease